MRDRVGAGYMSRFGYRRRRGRLVSLSFGEKPMGGSCSLIYGRDRPGLHSLEVKGEGVVVDMDDAFVPHVHDSPC